MQNAKDSMFVLIEASKLSFNDNFMQHEPTTDNQREYKKLLTGAIKSGLSDFWVSKLDPSFNEDKTNIVFEAGKMPAVDKSYNWWEEKSKQYLPERGSHLGTRTEYVAFLGVLIKSLATSGWSMDRAWKAVCDDSRELGNYRNSENTKHKFESTGSIEICGFCDLANIYKILREDEENSGCWFASGGCGDDSYNAPLAYLLHHTFQVNDYYYGIGWIVLSK